MPFTHLKMNEVGQQAYIMVGDQIKFEPAWILSKDVKDQVKDVRAVDALASVSGGLNDSSVQKISRCQRRSSASPT